MGKKKTKTKLIIVLNDRDMPEGEVRQFELEHMLSVYSGKAFFPTVGMNNKRYSCRLAKAVE